MNRLGIILTMVSVIVFCACSPTISTTVTSYKKYETVPVGIPIDVYRSQDLIRDKYEKIGEVKVGDSGFTTDCSLDKVTTEAINKCRQMGGNAIRITSLKEPDGWSTCWRLEAEVIRILAETVSKDEEHTEYNEFELKRLWESSGMQSVEGIYEQLVSNGGTKYKIGIKRVKDSEYIAVYLSGVIVQYSHLWKEGDLKAKIQRTATSNFYKCEWVMSNKNISNSYYITFESGVMKLVNEDGNEDIYYKLYPAVPETHNFSQGGSDSPAESVIARSSGTGFAINSANYIATNYHVVSEASSIYVRGIDKDYTNRHKASIVLSDKNNDIAILRIDNAPATSSLPYSIMTDLAEVGESVIALGYPLLSTMGEELKLSNGIISSRTGFQGNVTLYQLTVPVQPGNSGGPLFNEDGDVIGIIASKHVGTENVSYAIKISYLKNMIQMSGMDIPLSTNNTIRGLSMPKQVKQIRDYVYIIECM